MDFRGWLLTEAKIEEIPNYVLQSIQHLVGGDWKFLTPSRNDIPSLRFQWRFVCEIGGHNVRMDGDKFRLKMFIQCFKKREWAGKPPPAPEGYYLDKKETWWDAHGSPTKKASEYGEPFEKVVEYDPKNGHPLVRFAGALMGWRPGLMPGSEIDWETSAKIKGYPIAISRPGDFHHDMETIGRFWDEPQERGAWPDNRLNTPYEVAKFVKEAIDRFYRPRGDSDEPEPEPTPTPSSKVKVGVFR
jgi:hypothetical protein